MNGPSESEIVKALKRQLEEKTERCRRYEKEIADFKTEIEKYEEKLNHLSIMNRWKIGEYLHDNLAQKLNYAKILVSFLRDDLSRDIEGLDEKFNEVLILIDEGIKEVRDLSHDIIPAEIGDQGIIKAFTYLKNQVEARHRVECELEAGKVTERDIPKGVVNSLYLTAQEAVKNAVTHGEASKIKIALFEHEEQLYMHIKDNGRGFEPSSEEDGGVGLDIMRFRAKEMGGTFRIRGAREGEPFSTYVTCTVPLEKIIKH